MNTIKRIYPELERIKKYLISENILDEVAEFRSFFQDSFIYSYKKGLDSIFEICITANNPVFLRDETISDLISLDDIIYLSVAKYYWPYGEDSIKASRIVELDFKLADYQNENYLHN